MSALKTSFMIYQVKNPGKFFTAQSILLPIFPNLVPSFKLDQKSFLLHSGRDRSWNPSSNQQHRWPRIAFLLLPGPRVPSRKICRSRSPCLYCDLQTWKDLNSPYWAQVRRSIRTDACTTPWDQRWKCAWRRSAGRPHGYFQSYSTIYHLWRRVHRRRRVHHCSFQISTPNQPRTADAMTATLSSRYLWKPAFTPNRRSSWDLYLIFLERSLPCLHTSTWHCCHRRQSRSVESSNRGWCIHHVYNSGAPGDGLTYLSTLVSDVGPLE